ncbi:protein BEAN1 isoform X4 [Paroedura picta]|uniref:protein BEAN1 isoform X4 n=1 Tax=Paroedura picta TaxID=143630 RepID=UPI004057A2BB
MEGTAARVCSDIHLNQSGAVSKLSHYTEHSGDTNLMGSSVMVAGMVIGVVLFLSCVTIFVGSLRKDRRLRHPHLRRDPCYTPDGFSYGGSVGELRSSCIDEFPPALDFSYVETLSQVNIMHPDSPPRYEECVGPGAAQIYVPTDDPPPYSLTDPYGRSDLVINIPLEEEAAHGTTEQAAESRFGLQDPPQPISSISSSSSFTLEAAPPYETIVGEQNIPIPLVPLEVVKNSREDYQNVCNRIM